MLPLSKVAPHGQGQANVRLNKISIQILNRLGPVALQSTCPSPLPLPIPLTLFMVHFLLNSTDLLRHNMAGLYLAVQEGTVRLADSEASSEPKKDAPHIAKQLKRKQKEEERIKKKAEAEAEEVERKRRVAEQLEEDRRRQAEHTARMEENARQIRERNMEERRQQIAETQRQQRMRELNNAERIKALREKQESELDEQEKAMLETRKVFTGCGFGDFYNDAAWQQPDVSYSELRKDPKAYGSAMQLRCFYEYLENVWATKSTLIQWSHTRLDAVPPVISLFPYTVELNLSHNALTQPLPDNLAISMTQLRRLYLRHNQLTRLPPLDALANTLELLDVSHNKLTYLDDLSTLTNLQTLEIESNQLRFFPAGIDSLTKLSHLNIRSNQIKIVAPELGLLLEHNLTFLALRLNPITNIPPHVYLQGTRATLGYLLKHSGLAVDEEEGSLHKDLGALLREPFLVDVELQCLQGERLQAHACLLKARSTAFRSLLYEATPSKNNVRLLALDITLPQAQMLLDYVYTDKFHVPPIELMLSINSTMEWHQIETHNRVVKESYVAMMSALEAIALRFHMAYLVHLIREAKSPYEEKKMPNDQLPTIDADAKPLRASVQITLPGTTSSWKEDMAWLKNDVATHDTFFACVDPNGVPTRFSAHRLILCSRSPMMRAMLTGGMSETTEEAINVPAKDFYVQQAIIEFCYMDDVEDLQILEDNGGIARLLVKAPKMQLPRLQSILESVVGYSLDSENALHFIQLASAYQLPKLGRAAQYYIITHINAVQSSPEYATLDSDVRTQIDAMATTSDFESFHLVLPSTNAFNADD